MAPKLESEVDRLVARREQLFRRVQTCYDAGKLYSGNNKTAQNLEIFKTKYIQVSKTIDEFIEVTDRIIEINQQLKPTEKPSYEVLDALYDLTDTIEYLASLHIKKPVAGVNNEGTPKPPPSNIRMPKIELLKYDGEDLTLWPIFYDNFKNFIHIKREISDAEKLQYLLGSLTGKALRTCCSVEPIPDNYPIIWKLLEDTYQDSKMLANLYLDKLFNFRLNHNLKSNPLQTFLEIFHTNVTALKRLQIVDLEDYIFTYLAMTKLPTEVVQNFDLIRNTKDLPKYDNLLEFVRQQSKDIRVDIGRSSTHTSSKTTSHKSFFIQQSNSGKQINGTGYLKNNTNTNNSSTSTIANPNNCIICKNQFHPVAHCPQFLKLSPNSRYQLGKEKGLCINCLNPNHQIKFCKSNHSCLKCGSKHHSLLHFDRASPSISKENTETTQSYSKSVDLVPTVQTMCSREPCNNRDTTILLSTAVIYALDCNNQKRKIRVLLDCGSQSNFISYRCCRQLGLHISKSNLLVQGIGSTTKPIKGLSKLKIVSRFNDDSTYFIEALVIDEITNQLPSISVDTSKFEHIMQLPLADENYHIAGGVDGIIGAALLAELLGAGKVVGEPGSPIAIETALGYVVMGKAPILRCSVQSTQTFCAFESLENILNKFWEVENVPSITVLNQDDSECENLYRKTYSRNHLGRFTVALPFKHSPELLGNSYNIARRRFLALERKLEMNTEFRSAYDEVMRDYIDQNHISVVTQINIPEPSYYIPHHAIYKESSTTPVRIVFDASAKSDNSASLNDLLYAGPKLQKDLFSLLLDFRLFPIAITADLKQMFRQILLVPEHRKYQRLVWRFKPDHLLETYEINTVCFGVKSSPYLALRTVQQLAQDEAKNYPLASEVVQKYLYVDDLVYSAPDIIEAEKLYNEIVKLFSAGQFQVVKWASNSKNLMQKIPDPLKLNHDLDFDPTFKVLGLIWNPTDDHFFFRLGQFAITPTKRNVLSTLAQIFDPIGLLGSVTMFIKLMIKDYWILKLDWDTIPPRSLEQRWLTFLLEIEQLSNLKIPRYLSILSDSSVCLIGFADSSEKGYGAVIYLRSINNGTVKCTLVCSKSKVAPLKQQSIPRLELCAALLLSKLMRFVINLFESRIPLGDIFALSDSSVVLDWLNASPHRWHTFVANRVAKIQQDLPFTHWYHVPTNHNVADQLSRGLSPSQLVLSQDEWFYGPSWLLLEPSEWPIRKIDKSERPFLEEKSSIALPILHAPPQPIYECMENSSSWNKLLNTIVYVLKFVKILPRGASISLEDLNLAEETLIKIVQEVHFSNEIKILKEGKLCPLTLRHLNPFVDNKGILRVGGRLSRANISYDHQHPIFLPNKGHFVELLIRHTHNQNLHVGVHLLSSLLRQKFWIIAGRNVIRKIVGSCNFCFRHKPQPSFPMMADLPAPRINQAKAFLHTGTDFAGPYRITMSRYRGNRVQKAYLCLFVCLTTKAVHLELCSDLSTAIFMAALKRFLSRRGPVQFLYSDCGTNYIGARSELKELYNLIEQGDYVENFKRELLKNKISWNLNPPRAPHFGGIWEGNIKSIKSILHKAIGEQLLTYEEFNTVIIQVEALMNSRPLYNIGSSDPSDPTALTPAHFLNTSPLLHLPAPQVEDGPSNLLKRKLLLDKIVQSYWKRWHVEYLSTLQSRLKWNTPQSPVSVGTVVVLINENQPPLQWALGVITEVYPGADGVVRVASVKTATGVYKRPVVKLCPLPTQ